MGRQTSARWGKQAIFELNASMSLARWSWRLLHYFKQVVNLSATCFHVESEQFLSCIRVARVCQRQLGFLVLIGVARRIGQLTVLVFLAWRSCWSYILKHSLLACYLNYSKLIDWLTYICIMINTQIDTQKAVRRHFKCIHGLCNILEIGLSTRFYLEFWSTMILNNLQQSLSS